MAHDGILFANEAQDGAKIIPYLLEIMTKLPALVQISVCGYYSDIDETHINTAARELGRHMSVIILK